MPIDSEFPKSHQVIGKYKHADGEHFHFVWGPGRPDAESSTKPEQDIPGIEMANATSEGTGENSMKDVRKDYTDKSDPIREHDCIWCMACVSVCPPQAVKVDQSNLEAHEKAAGTFNEDLAKGSAPPPHAH